MIDDTRLADHLREADLLTAQQVEQAKVLQDREDRPLYETVIAHDLVDETPLVAIVSDILNVDSVDLSEFDPSADVLEMVPAEVAFDNWALPLEIEQVDGQDRLVLAMRDPIDMMAMDEIADYTDIDIRPVLAGPRALHEALVRSYDREADFELAPAGAPDSDSSMGPASTEDSDPNNNTHPGLVTSGVAESEVEDELEDPAEPLDTEVDSMAVPPDQIGEDFADSSPAAPADSDLGPPSEPEELAADSSLPTDSQAIGRIPVKRIPASQLANDSSGAVATSEPSDSAIDLGAPVAPPESEEPSEPASDGGTLVAEAPQIGGGESPVPSEEDAPDSEAEADLEPEPVEDEEAENEPANDEEAEDEPAEDERPSDEADDEAPADEQDDSPLSSLRRRLKKNKKNKSTAGSNESAPTDTSETSDEEDEEPVAETFVARVAEIAGSLDDDAEAQLSAASPRALVEATVLGLLDAGVLSVADLLEHLQTDDD